ncbi:uncharacterized protein LOC116125518 [Pistacia vera]|uniref:uncharacterized protein LOC116125518 n=1 Tax=Pistacia vera TaxID=55513 RepID=UPI001263528A|nr:uncharacterized protein LOC116125518 [Pistacia vera]
MISPLTASITDDEIRIALFSILDDKAPGLDGFTSLFFKRAWNIIGIDFRDAVRHFFATNEMPRCVNATRIALVPKFKVVLPDIIGVSQSAFVPGRRISDNILLTQKLLRNYHLGGTSPRCALKVDIRKAFDTSFTVFLGPPGVFGKGTLCSPYLFVLAMEGLAVIFWETSHSPGFHYHWRCRRAAITHLCFADDLMVFCRAVASFVSLIKSALDYFAKVIGLVTNAEKS